MSRALAARCEAWQHATCTVQFAHCYLTLDAALAAHRAACSLVKELALPWNSVDCDEMFAFDGARWNREVDELNAKARCDAANGTGR